MFLKSLLKETRFGASLLFLLVLSMGLRAQPGYGPSSSMSSGEMLEQLRKLQVLGKVLYVAAHPDDENTRLLAWLALEKKVETAYLSLTRGDGGQNLIGKEVREGLGLIRTQELLAARRTDGAQQFFTRANDFGYSKNPEETFTKWDRDSLLADVVWVIRKFQPDVIITRFNPEPSPTHGHHTASAQLAVEAFAAAADPKRFPEQLAFLKPWQAKSLYWNTSWWFFGRQDFDKTGFLPLDVGSYNVVLGTGYGEIASASRSMHKSQGFGAARQRGEEVEYLKPLAGETSLTSLFAGLDFSWTRAVGAADVLTLLQAAEKQFDPSAPWKMLPALIKAANALDKLPQSEENERWKALKRQQLDVLIASAAGIWQDVLANRFAVSAGDSLTVTLRTIVRHPVKVQLQQYRLQGLQLQPVGTQPFTFETIANRTPNQSLSYNQLTELSEPLVVGQNRPYANPFWLNGRVDNGFFELPDLRWVGYPENPAAYQLQARYRLEVGGEVYVLQLTEPVYYRWTDPADGERYRPLEILPALHLRFSEQNYISTGAATEIEVVVTAEITVPQASVALQLPFGWLSEPETQGLTALRAGAEYRLKFTISPGKAAATGTISASVTANKRSYNSSLRRISYPHLPIQMQLLPAEAQLLKLDIQRKKRLIGYLAGAGDEIPEALLALGYQVEIIPIAACTPDQLQKYESIVTGVRIANTEAGLQAKMPVLMDYVARGGTLVFQYNTSQGVQQPLGPYPFRLGRDRVTVEQAPVQFLQKDHPLFSYPNKITNVDFEGWVQERGLYFPASWDTAYTPLLRMNDPGESPLEGALLYARYGKGVYIYSGLSWFRQLPAGVPGAYRIFVNLIEAKGE